MFHDSIKNNLRIAKLDAIDKEMAAACKKASVHDFIMSLPRSYDTPVGELGDTLSGAVGAVLPLLPAFPFLLLAAVCFGKSSERLNTWFIGTKLYKNNLESFVQGKGMTKKTKSNIMIMVTLLMSIGFAMMGSAPVGQVILSIVWVFHIVYFIFGIKTIPLDSAKKTPGSTC